MKEKNFSRGFNEPRKVNCYGYPMTPGQKATLGRMLRQDILERYDNEEYYDRDIIEAFAQDNNLGRA